MKKFLRVFFVFCLLLISIAAISSCDQLIGLLPGGLAGTTTAADTTTPVTTTEATTAPPVTTHPSSESLEYYPLSDGTYAVAVGRAILLEEIVIPETYNGRAVTAIIDEGFKGCSNLKTITIPDSVASIGESAFSGCSSLERITLPFVGGSKTATSASTSTLFGYIFGTSSYEGGVSTKQYYSSSSYATYYIPASLKTVTVTGGNILYGAFRGCTGLTSIVIPNSVTSIGKLAFDGCTGLTSITIPSSVTSIGEWAFAFCTGIEGITVANGNPVYHSEGNCLIETSEKTLILGCKNSIIPTGGSVTEIGEWAFLDCTGLESIVIPEGVTRIDDSAFYGCDGLTSITIADSVTTIIGISHCKALETIVMGRGVEIVGEGAFSGCDALKSVYITDLAAWCSIDFYEGQCNPLRYADNLYINGERVTSLVIPQEVTEISANAFYGFSGINEVVLPEGLVSLGDGAFDGCDSLEYNEYKNFQYIGSIENPFMVLLQAKNRYYDSVIIHPKTRIIASGAFYDCVLPASVTIPEGVTSIGSMAFAYTNLQAIKLPEGLKRIGAFAFYFSDLTSITIPYSVTEIGAFAFELTEIDLVTFQNTVGWKAEHYPSKKTAEFSSAEIANERTAAKYLRSTYDYYTWTRE